MSGAVFLAIGQAVFNDRLYKNVGQVVSRTVVNEINSAGATGFRSVTDVTDLPIVLEAYSRTITQVFVSLNLKN